MTRPTKAHAVTYRVSKLRVFFPRFDVVDCNIVFGKRNKTILAGVSITLQTRITPFFVKYVISPLNIISKILLGFEPLGSTLLLIGGFIRTFLRTKTSCMSIVRISVEHSLTSFTKFAQSLFSHDIMIAYQYEK